MGAYLMIRSSIFRALNGFDERFFVYFEDVDLSLRARRQGWKSYHFAGARAYHKGRGTSEQVRARRLFYSLRSRLIYGCRHFTFASLLGLFLTTVCIEPFSRIVFALLCGRPAEAGETIKAYGFLIPELLEILRSRPQRLDGVAAASSPIIETSK
jgi:GT2 family glycosyltransferase